MWKDEIVLDPRIGARMRRFELSAEEEERARRIGQGVEEGRAVEVRDLRKAEVIVGRLDEE